MTEQTMTIREMCEAFDVTPRTLRFYESKGLLAPIRVGTKRLFTRRDRGRLKLILRGKRFGFSLEQIGELLDIYDTDDKSKLTQIERTLPIARTRLAELESQRQEIEKAIVDLRRQIATGEQIVAAGDLTLDKDDKNPAAA